MKCRIFVDKSIRWMIRSDFHSSTQQLCPMGMYACWLHPKLCCTPHKQLILAFRVSKSRLQRMTKNEIWLCRVTYPYKREDAEFSRGSEHIPREVRASNDPRCKLWVIWAGTGLLKCYCCWRLFFEIWLPRARNRVGTPSDNFPAGLAHILVGWPCF